VKRESACSGFLPNMGRRRAATRMTVVGETLSRRRCQKRCREYSPLTIAQARTFGLSTAPNATPDAPSTGIAIRELADLWQRHRRQPGPRQGLYFYLNGSIVIFVVGVVTVSRRR